MRKMNNVVTIRLPKEDIEAVKKISEENKRDKSATLRELVSMGKIYLALMEYKDGKISIGRAAEISGLPLSELMDLFSKLGIKSNIEADDYLEGRKYGKEII